MTSLSADVHPSALGAGDFTEEQSAGGFSVLNDMAKTRKDDETVLAEINRQTDEKTMCHVPSTNAEDTVIDPIPNNKLKLISALIESDVSLDTDQFSTLVEIFRATEARKLALKGQSKALENELNSAKQQNVTRDKAIADEEKEIVSETHRIAREAKLLWQMRERQYDERKRAVILGECRLKKSIQLYAERKRKQLYEIERKRENMESEKEIFELEIKASEKRKREMKSVKKMTKTLHECDAGVKRKNKLGRAENGQNSREHVQKGAEESHSRMKLLTAGKMSTNVDLNDALSESNVNNENKVSQLSSIEDKSEELSIKPLLTKSEDDRTKSLEKFTPKKKTEAGERSYDFGSPSFFGFPASAKKQVARKRQRSDSEAENSSDDDVNKTAGEKRRKKNSEKVGAIDITRMETEMTISTGIEDADTEKTMIIEGSSTSVSRNLSKSTTDRPVHDVKEIEKTEQVSFTHPVIDIGSSTVNNVAATSASSTAQSVVASPTVITTPSIPIIPSVITKPSALPTPSVPSVIITPSAFLTLLTPSVLTPTTTATPSFIATSSDIITPSVPLIASAKPTEVDERERSPKRRRLSQSAEAPTTDKARRSSIDSSRHNEGNRDDDNALSVELSHRRARYVKSDEKTDKPAKKNDSIKSDSDKMGPKKNDLDEEKDGPLKRNDGAPDQSCRTESRTVDKRRRSEDSEHRQRSSRSIQPEHGKSDKPERSKADKSEKSGHEKSGKPEHDESKNSEYGKSNKSDKSGHSKSSTSNEPEHEKSDKQQYRKSEKSDKPEDDNSDKPGPGKSDKPEHSKSEKPVHGKSDKPEHAKSEKPQHGKSGKPEHGKYDKQEHGKKFLESYRSDRQYQSTGSTRSDDRSKSSGHRSSTHSEHRGTSSKSSSGSSTVHSSKEPHGSDRSSKSRGADKERATDSKLVGNKPTPVEDDKQKKGGKASEPVAGLVGKLGKDITVGSEKPKDNSSLSQDKNKHVEAKCEKSDNAQKNIDKDKRVTSEKKTEHSVTRNESSDQKKSRSSKPEEKKVDSVKPAEEKSRSGQNDERKSRSSTKPDDKGDRSVVSEKGDSSGRSLEKKRRSSVQFEDEKKKDSSFKTK